MTFADESNIYLGFNAATCSTITGMDDVLKNTLEHYYETVPEVNRTIFNTEPIFQMWLFSDQHEVFAEKFKKQARIVPWLENGADIIPLNSSKATGVTKLLEANLGQLPEKVIFFGDGINDIELVEMADIGIAMGNAVDQLKEKADFITKNIEDDGIYYACEQLNLFKKEELI